MPFKDIAALRPDNKYGHKQPTKRIPYIAIVQITVKTNQSFNNDANTKQSNREKDSITFSGQLLKGRPVLSIVQQTNVNAFKIRNERPKLFRIVDSTPDAIDGAICCPKVKTGLKGNVEVIDVVPGFEDEEVGHGYEEEK